MTDNYIKTRKAAAAAIIEWAQTGMGEINMREAVNGYLAAIGANHPSFGGEETVLSRRKMAVNRLLIDCLYALSKAECSKVDKELDAIAADFHCNKKL